MYLCPNCGVPLNFGERFCGSCGTGLNWSIQMPFQSMPPSFNYQRQNQNTPSQNPQFSYYQYQQQESEESSSRHTLIKQDANEKNEIKPKKRRSKAGIALLMVFLCFLSAGAALTFATDGTFFTSLIKNNQPVYKLPAGDMQQADAVTPVVNFTAAPSNITPGQVTVLTWDVSGADSVSIDQGIGSVTVSGTRTITPSTTTTYTLTAAGSSSSITSSAVVEVNTANTAGEISFSANPITIAAGQSSTLQWHVPGASSVVIDPGIGKVAESGTMTVIPGKTQTYTLTASISAGSRSLSTTVIVTSGVLPVINSFIANPVNISIGQASILKWNVTGANSVSIDQGIGTVDMVGTKPVTPGATTTYTLTATNESGSVDATATVSINSTNVPVIFTFSVNPNNINSGQTATIRWNVSGAASIYIYPAIGVSTLEKAGSQTISPATSTTYTIVATNSAGSATQSTTVIVAPPGSPVITTFISNPSTIETGDSSTLVWSVTGADSISIFLGTDNASNLISSGALEVKPTSTTTYTVSATNSAGVITAQTTVYVISPEQSLVFEAEPGYIDEGQSSTLTWTLIGGESVFIDQGIGESTSSGSVIVTPSATTMYTLTSDTITLTATVTVVKSGSPLIESFTADPLEISSGEFSTLQWNIPGAMFVSINPAVGAVSSTGVIRVRPEQTTTYTIMALNNNGYVYKSVTVTVD